MRGQQRKFDRFREEFNQERPHESLEMKRPAWVYERSQRSMPMKIEIYDYPAHYLVRRVSRSGTIRLFHNQVFVSNTLNEDYVGLEEVDDGVYDSSVSITSAVTSCGRTRFTILCRGCR